ncbi:MAG: sterol desaturase family protein [Bacteriovoracaceae bacterium]|jgi:alkylglycerol monooxygenase|nr:sterol desaturase family protein [Bacteriovoracaceae bacterium]
MLNIYSILTPIALTLVIIELIYCRLKKKHYFNFQDSMASFYTAIGNQLINLIVAGLVILSYGYLYQYRIITIEDNSLSFVLLILSIDFLFYWFHRLGHTVNIFWAAHSPHHSAEEFNLAVALRASFTQRLFSFFFFWPLTLIGFNPEIIYIATGVHLILGYWHHTKVIPKLGWFEVLFNSPSHHRVHHGTNEEYLDKNYSEVLIIWDKLFGTFEEEQREVNYGILRHPESWGPMAINFHFWGLLWKDCLETKSYLNKFRLWFMPLGWRPPDVSFRPSIGPIEVGEKEKFSTPMFSKTKPYLIGQLVIGLLAMVFVIHGSTPLNILEKIIMSILIWMMIIAWGGILEMKSWALKLEVVRLILMTLMTTYLFKRYSLGFSIEYILIPIALISMGWIFLYFKNDQRTQFVSIPEF